MSELTGLARSFDALFSPSEPETSEAEASDEVTPHGVSSEDAVREGLVEENVPDDPTEHVFDDLTDVGAAAGGALAASTAADLTHEEPVFEAMGDVGADDRAPEPDAFEVDAFEPDAFEPDAADPDAFEPDAFEPGGSVGDLEVELGVPDASSFEDEVPGEAVLEDAVLEDAVLEDVVLEDVVPDEVVLEEPAVEQVVTDDPPVVEASAVTESAGSDVADDEVPVTPLDLAVAEFLEGGEANAAELDRLASECLERRELDPIARAVATLTLAAGDPPDPAIYSAAEPMMTPIILGRLARHIGKERVDERRHEYYQVCRTIGSDMANAIRADLADNTDRLARRNLCAALVEMGAPGRQVVDEMAVDENCFLVRNAVSILGDAGGDRAVELCTSALANPDARVRREALLSLAKLGDPESGAIIVGLLEDPDAKVRLAAAVAAGELRAERALRPLIAMLEGTKDPDEALPVIRALGRIGDPGAVVSIEKHATTSLFSRPRTDVRINAYRALNEIGTPHARRLLNQAIDDKDPAVKSAVKEILGLR